MIGRVPTSDYIERRLGADFPEEDAVVEARLDPVLCSLADDLVPNRDANAPLALSALVLSRCRRSLMQAFGRDMVEIAARAVFLDLFDRREHRGFAWPADEPAALREAAWFGLLARHTRASYRTGLMRGCLVGLGLAVVTDVALRLLLP
jgi:hypothetical protein